VHRNRLHLSIVAAPVNEVDRRIYRPDNLQYRYLRPDYQFSDWRGGSYWQKGSEASGFPVAAKARAREPPQSVR
jgi:hypothetical protein